MCYMQNKSVIYNKQPKHVMYNNKNNIFTQPKFCYVQINNTLNMLYIYIQNAKYVQCHIYPCTTPLLHKTHFFIYKTICMAIAMATTTTRTAAMTIDDGDYDDDDDDDDCDDDGDDDHACD